MTQTVPPTPTFDDQPPFVDPQTVTPPVPFDGPPEPPKVPEVDHLMGWTNLDWSLYVGGLVAIPICLMLLLYWTVLKQQRSTCGEPTMSPSIALAALAAATIIPGVYVILGFNIARHCTRTDYVTLVLVLTVVAHVAFYGLLTWGGLMRSVVAMTAKMLDRQWRSSWLLTAAPPTVLILIGLAIRWIDDLYRTAASEGRTIGELVGVMVAALLGLWAWVRGDDTSNGQQASPSPAPQGARSAPIYGSNNIVIQGDVDGRDFHFR